MQHVWERGEVYTGFWWGNLRERDHFEDTDVDGRIVFRWIFRMWGERAWIGLIGFRIDRLRALVNAIMNLRVP